jgi:hypothetical protein
MPAHVRCGRRMDGSGPGRVFSSPNREPAELIERGFSEPLCEDERLPLPPGHPLSWGPLTQGTVLEGSAYGDAL